jgi:hypothetical protein
LAENLHDHGAQLHAGVQIRSAAIGIGNACQPEERKSCAEIIWTMLDVSGGGSVAVLDCCTATA